MNGIDDAMTAGRRTAALAAFVPEAGTDTRDLVLRVVISKAVR